MTLLFGEGLPRDGLGLHLRFTKSGYPTDRVRDMKETITTTAAELMNGFLQREKRYLWTDAYAVLNLLWLDEPAQVADLVDDVHRVLGRHRKDDSRDGWLSGASEEKGLRHPTQGGLRIGKPLPERSEAEAVNTELEWERDGQYFHYLTRWAHALWRAGDLDSRYVEWARELMRTASEHFLYENGSDYRMYWKMSIDLTRPLVTSMGQHDPLDGLVTCLCLGDISEQFLHRYRTIVDRQDLVTTDPLGLGGMLSATSQLEHRPDEGLLHERLIKAALIGLAHYRASLGPQASACGRLGFRELGLAIGLRQCADERLLPYRSLADEIVEFWSRPMHQKTESWQKDYLCCCWRSLVW